MTGGGGRQSQGYIYFIFRYFLNNSYHPKTFVLLIYTLSYPLSNFSIRHLVKDINLYQSIPIAQKIKTNKRKNEFKKLNFALPYICFTIFFISYLVKFFFHFRDCVKIHLVEDTWVLCKHVGNNDAIKN